MKTSPRQLFAVFAAGALLGITPLRAADFSTQPQRAEVTKAAEDAAKAADSAAKAQEKAPTDPAQAAINSAENAADDANNAANRAADTAQHAQQRADQLAKTAKTEDEVKAAKDAADAAKAAQEDLKKAEDLAKQTEREAKKAVDDQTKADKKNMDRLKVHTARERQRQARRLLANAVRRLEQAWARVKLDPAKAGVKLTEEERRKTQEKLNEGRGALGLPSVSILAARAVLPANTLASLLADRKIQADITGTGKTIGHIATLQLKNLTDQKISVAVPPLVLESKSGKTQHYVCPEGSTVALNPKEEKPVKQDGICISRSKPPVGNGVGGDLAINDGSGNTPGSAFTPAQVDKLVNTVASYYDGAAKLEKDGKLAKVPYKDPAMRQEIVTQWGVWSDPKICEITKEVPANKEDLAKTVYRQTEEHTPVTPEIKKKLDTGITDIFASVQLTTKEAKDLEPATAFADNSIPISDDRPDAQVRPPAPEVPLEKVLADTIGALMNREGILQDTLNKDPELRAKVQRWLEARDRANRVKADRERRADAAKKAEKLREEARNLRNTARNTANPQTKASLEAAANSLEQNAAGLDTQATATPEQRQEGRTADKDLQQAESAVPEHIKTEVDNALKEQAAPPPPREAQERMEVGPDGKIVEPPAKR